MGLIGAAGNGGAGGNAADSGTGGDGGDGGAGGPPRVGRGVERGLFERSAHRLAAGNNPSGRNTRIAAITIFSHTTGARGLIQRPT